MLETRISHARENQINSKMTSENLKIIAIDVKDVRFPTSLGLHGSDAMVNILSKHLYQCNNFFLQHTDPDYSCAYVTIKIGKKDIEGHGHAFTLGRGTEIVVSAIKTLSELVIGQTVFEIYKDFAKFWRSLTSESQIRWVLKLIFLIIRT